jgi:thiopurine S-methyltransferase
MEASFWIDRWTEGQIGFHLDEINPALIRHWPKHGHDAMGPVLVPLCGKSRDLHYLRELGHSVTGIELSPVAVGAFWEESHIIPSVVQDGPQRIFEGDRIRLIEGDFFTTRPDQFETPAWVYDRAALIALPPLMRDRYCHHLLSLAPDAPILLITLDHDPDEKEGPPFPVTPSEVKQRFGASHTIEVLESRDVLEENPPFKNRGVSALTEHVFLLTPN